MSPGKKPPKLSTFKEQRIYRVHVYCTGNGCGHTATVAVDDLPPDADIISLRALLRCSKCGHKRNYAMPDWSDSNEYHRSIYHPNARRDPNKGG